LIPKLEMLQDKEIDDISISSDSISLSSGDMFDVNYCCFNDYPVQLNCIEMLEGTLDNYIEKTDNNIPDVEWKSILFQVCFGLAVAQKNFDFVHNDLHSSNIMFKATELEYLYFNFKGTYFKIPTFGKISNFSFYYAHHMSTIEGGMICTNDEKIYEMARSLRSHGMLREIKSKSYQKKIIKKHKDLNSQFIFLYPAYNVRSTEINAVIGINQIKRLNSNIDKRNKNCRLFNSLIDNEIFFTNFDMKGMSNYAFNLILKKKNNFVLSKLIKALNKNGIEFRMGSAGGGNQLRQPYVKNLKLKINPASLKNTDHIHKYGMYIGNYPELKSKDIKYICKIINESVK